MDRRTFQVETEQQRERFAHFVERQIPPFQVELGPLRKQRTTSQNARWWLLMTRAAEVSGHSPRRSCMKCASVTTLVSWNAKLPTY